MNDFPAWYYGPEGQQQVFQRAEDVPEGWQDHPSKVITPAKTGDQSNTLDAHGWAWDPKLHAATQSMTKDGLWRPPRRRQSAGAERGLPEARAAARPVSSKKERRRHDASIVDHHAIAA
jgi:hypothetical protein